MSLFFLSYLLIPHTYLAPAKDTILINLDKQVNVKSFICEQEDYKVLTINIFFDAKGQLSSTDTSSKILVSIHLMPQFDTKSVSLCKIPQISKGLKSTNFLNDISLSRIKRYYGQCKHDLSVLSLKDTDIFYILKYKNHYYHSTGEALTEFFFITQKGTIFPNENDYISIDPSTKPFTQYQFIELMNQVDNPPYLSGLINNVFDRTFLQRLPTLEENNFLFWVSPASVNKDYILIKRQNKWYDAGWYDEENYKFLYASSLGIVGREFNKFFDRSIFVHANENLPLESIMLP